MSEDHQPAAAGSSEEEYNLEDVELSLADFIAPASAAVTADVSAAWDALAETEAVQTYQLSSMNTVEGA